jgi:exopolyphosphatase / guanosine-5'-triphosphate,3'-diphosphate pyrophosphatase
VRVAAIDLGTHSTRLLVADITDGNLAEVVRRLAITRLGEGVDETGRLGAEPVARVKAQLAAYRRECDALGVERVLATATSAVRDARNGEAFLADLEADYGFVTRLLSGEEEAELTFRGVTFAGALTMRTLLVDIGGGSTELVLGDARGVRSTISLQIGCVRLSERFLLSDPPSTEELDACAGHLRGLLPELEAPTAIGVAGTVTTLAAIDLGLDDYDPERIHGHRLSRTAVVRELAHLAAVSLDERRRIRGLEPARAPVIVAGAVILFEILDRFRLDEILVSERDILHGAALSAATL